MDIPDEYNGKVVAEESVVISYKIRQWGDNSYDWINDQGDESSQLFDTIDGVRQDFM